jgi:hypothetical protein
VGVALRAREQVPGSPVMHDDGVPGLRSSVLDRNQAAGWPGDLCGCAHSQTLAGDAWAAGSCRNNTTGATNTLILHWNGTSWSRS